MLDLYERVPLTEVIVIHYLQWSAYRSERPMMQLRRIHRIPAERSASHA